MTDHSYRGLPVPIRPRSTKLSSTSFLPSRLKRAWMFSPARVRSISPYFLKGSLVDPRMRASNEHLLSVRVPRAGGRPGCPHPATGWSLPS